MITYLHVEAALKAANKFLKLLHLANMEKNFKKKEYLPNENYIHCAPAFCTQIQYI